ncbi:hypothetical protein Acr_22g0005710 [Actinidia rufa]|uniref:Retrotransposon Copia-like N-terminal domain-containing protein n=1 Tax=Actinidia rufa TaxID=165716 RepID=A0A7J0GK41_9ERIC|nr:hypothetical protein Acr_22g0005710 [Actinidia rufa]
MHNTVLCPWSQQYPPQNQYFASMFQGHKMSHIILALNLPLQAAQTLNPTATTFSLLRSLGQPPAQPLDSHQPPVQPCATRQPPTQPPAQASVAAPTAPTSLQTATTPALQTASVQPLPAQPPSSLCAASVHSRQQPLCSPCAAQPPLPTAPAPARCSLALHSRPTGNHTQLTLCRLVHLHPSPRGCPNSYGPEPSSVSLSHSQPTQRITSVLLNGKNFHAWSRSFQLYPSRKRKTRWILGKKSKPAEAPTALLGLVFEEDFWQGYERDGLYYFGDPLPSHDPIPPRPLPILEPPSSPSTPYGSLPRSPLRIPVPALRIPCQYLLRSQAWSSIEQLKQVMRHMAEWLEIDEVDSSKSRST